MEGRKNEVEKKAGHVVNKTDNEGRDGGGKIEKKRLIRVNVKIKTGGKERGKKGI